MKEMMLVMFLALPAGAAEMWPVTGVVPADKVLVAPTPTDSLLLKGWNLLTDEGKSLHFLDNGTGASLYDYGRNEWLAGVMTSVYQPKVNGKDPFSLDFGVAKSAESDQSGFPLLAIRFHGREMLDRNSAAKRFFENRQNLLRYLTCGGWGARDWGYGFWRGGFFIGAEAKWGQ